MKSFEEAVISRLQLVEREVERLRVKESPGVWIDWTPTVGIVGSGTAPTFSDTFINRYCKIGHLVFVYGSWWNKVGDMMGSGTGYVTATLPVPIATSAIWITPGQGGGTFHTIGYTVISVYTRETTFSFTLLDWTNLEAGEFASVGTGIDFTFTYEAA